MKLNPTMTGVVYFTYLGGSDSESIFQRVRLALDPSGSAYVTGGTNSTDFPVTAGAPNAVPGQGFAAKLNASGALVYSTYLAGRGSGVAVDPAGNAYVASQSDAVRRINAAGTAFDWTYPLDARDVI